MLKKSQAQTFIFPVSIYLLHNSFPLFPLPLNLDSRKVCLKLLREEVFCSYLITELDSLSIMSWRMSSHKLRENGQISVKTSNNVSLIRWTKKKNTKKQKRHEKNKTATRKRRLNHNITICRET